MNGVMDLKMKLCICLLVVMMTLSVAVCAAEETTPSLTPNGNMTLIDDYVIGDTQYITVQTKSGNYFYIIIDRSGETENVHFLNKVDEADLLPLLEDESIFDFGTDTEVEEEPPVIEPDDKTEQRKEILTRGLVLAGIFAAVGGGIYVFSKKKLKKGNAKPDNHDDDADDVETAGAVSENTYVRENEADSAVTVYENDANEDDYEEDEED